MTNCKRALTPAAIKYLLTLFDLGEGERGVRSVDLAARMNVSKPGAHSMIRNLCAAGLAEKERYGTVYLTEEGRTAAALYRDCFEPLYRKMQSILPLDGETCANAVCAVLSQVPEELPRLAGRIE